MPALVRPEFQTSNSQPQCTSPLHRGQEEFRFKSHAMGMQTSVLRPIPLCSSACRSQDTQPINTRVLWHREAPISFQRKQFWRGREDCCHARRQPQAVTWWYKDILRCEGSCSKGTRQGCTMAHLNIQLCARTRLLSVHLRKSDGVSHRYTHS